MKIFIDTIGIIFLLNTAAFAQNTTTKNKIIKIENDHVYFESYIYNETIDFDISDLELDSDWEKNDKIFNTVYTNYTSDDFRELLLENGLAIIKDVTKAKERDLEAQNRAKSENLGFWKTTTNSKNGWTILGLKLWNIILILGSLGILSTISQYLYKKFFIEKKVSLLFIGLPACGKTTFIKRLKNPKISEKELLNTTPSTAYESHSSSNVIRRAKYEIYPRIGDTPGTRPDIILDKVYASKLNKVFTFRNACLLVLLSPFINNGVENNKVKKYDINKDIDFEFISEQLGYIKGLVKGILRSVKTRKPKVLILFINKFDLISDYPPGDSVSLSLTKVIENVFSKHIQEIKIICDNLRIPCEIVIGSPVKKWNVEETLDIIVEKLYS
jgi:hypothetical protein